MRYAVTIVMPPGYVHSGAFREVGETLHHALRRLGHDSVLTDDAAPPGRRPIVLGSNLLPGSGQRVARDAILYNLEQIEPGSHWLTPALLELFRRHEVWDYSERNAARYAELGLPRPRVVPIGYVPELTRIPPAPGEDIDVLFYGSVNERRRRVLDALRARGLRVEAAFGVYGEARDRLVARARLVLNVHYFEAKVFEIVRVSYLLANGRCVVSERGADAGEERALEEGVAFASYDALVDTCERLVRDAPARARVARRGQELMMGRDAIAYLREALEGGEPARAAPVEARATSEEPCRGAPASAPGPGSAPPSLSLDDVVAMVRPAGLRILAVACGQGELAAGLLAAGAVEVVGLDPCARGDARARLTAVLQLDPDGAPELPYPEGYFDALLVEDLSRLERPAAALRHLRRWLADAGRLVCVAPNATHEAALAALLREGRLPPWAGSRPMTAAAALAALAEADFAVEDEVILVRTEAGPAAAGLAAAAVALGVDPDQAADGLALVRAILAARPRAARGKVAAPLADPWRGSRPLRVLVAPDLADPRDRWAEALAALVRGFAGNERVTVGLALPLPFLSALPAAVQTVAEGAKVDLLLVEAPVDRDGWERLVAGASVWVPSSEHAVVAAAARRVGTDMQEAG